VEYLIHLVWSNPWSHLWIGKHQDVIQSHSLSTGHHSDLLASAMHHRHLNLLYIPETTHILSQHMRPNVPSSSIIIPNLFFVFIFGIQNGNYQPRMGSCFIIMNRQSQLHTRVAQKRSLQDIRAVETKETKGFATLVLSSTALEFWAVRLANTSQDLSEDECIPTRPLQFLFS